MALNPPGSLLIVVPKDLHPTRITMDRHGLNLTKSAMGKKIKQSLAGTLSVSIRVWTTFALFWVFPKNMKDCGE
jgi:hypothetical protein